MVPTYEPGPHLEAALAGVLAQDPGPADMQIEVVDDASPRADTAALVRRIAGGRVAVHRQPANVGLARNWNECVRRAAGHVVHVLHQDDVIRPGFYAALRRGFDGPEPAGAAFCRYEYLDADGRPLGAPPAERETPGPLGDWLRKIATSQRVACSSVVVRRDVYAAVGGFRTDLVYALDWEMWARIAGRYRYWYEPAVLCGFRTNHDSETRRLRRSADTVRDMLKCLDITRSYLPPHQRAACRRAGRRFCATDGLNAAFLLARAGDYLPAARAFRQAFAADPAAAVGRVLRWAAKQPGRAFARPAADGSR